MKSQADRLFERALATGDRSEASALLQEFIRGYPLERLRLLLRSENQEAVKTGIFIASELGRAVRPLVDEFGPLLTHESSAVRFDALDCALVCGTEKDGKLLARAATLIDDGDEGVRYKALDFLSRATVEQLLAAARHVLNPELASALSWLASRESATHARILAELGGDEPVRRRVAVAAAARPAKFDEEALAAAALSRDPDVSTFAQSRLRVEERIRKGSEKWNRARSTRRGRKS